MQLIDFERLERLAASARDGFQSADPFPHAVFDDFLPVEAARAVQAEFERPNPAWKHYTHYNERKFALTDVEQMLPACQALFEALQSEAFVRFIENLTGIRGLLADPDLDGAGLHRSSRGGFLNLHVDFLSHTRNRSWSRQVNLLLYLNPDWQEEWGGQLEFWDEALTRCARRIAPVFNRCVVFHTSGASYHGHPSPLVCPEGVWRNSIAAYYFRDEGRPLELSSTNYRGHAGDALHKRALIRLDRALLHLYSFLKRYTPLDDRLVSRILKRF